MFPYIENIVIFGSIFSIISLSLNLSIGWTGLFNLGHAAFCAIGAYVSALVMLSLGFPFWIAIISAALFTALMGYLISIPTRKLRGDYMALGTLGFAFILEAALKNLIAITRGPLGIPGIPKPELFGFVFSSLDSFTVLAVLFLAITTAVIYAIVSSPYGRLLRSIREDETAAQILGKNVRSYKSAIVTISAFFAGLAGSLYAHYVTFIDPTSFSFITLVLMVSMVLIGGTASIKGSIAGAFLLILIPEPLRFVGLPANLVGAGRQMIYAFLLVIILLKRPYGLFREYKFRKIR